LVRPSAGAQQRQERDPKIVQMTLKDKNFVNKFKVSFVCNPEEVWPSNFGKCLKMPKSNLSTKKYFFLTFLKFVQSFVKCKVSLADGS
jgi:hypothetical protein